MDKKKVKLYRQLMTLRTRKDEIKSEVIRNEAAHLAKKAELFGEWVEIEDKLKDISNALAPSDDEETKQVKPVEAK